MNIRNYKHYYINVTNVALCQKCLRLAFYSIFLKRKTSFIGLKSSGYYGTIFHNKIAGRFFEAASNPEDSLHNKIIEAIKKGRNSFYDLIRREIFYEFVSTDGKKYLTEQISALASGTEVWINAIWDFLLEIPSLLKSPENNMRTVFQKPEGNVQGTYKQIISGIETELTITGRYDALLFNPDKKQARLFEFKGYKKSDVTVPLSQSLIYAWLIHENTGIFPEIEIMHLSDLNAPIDRFSSLEVQKMIKSALPNLFEAACKVFFLNEVPAPAFDKNLCKSCKYKNSCVTDINKFILKHNKNKKES